MHIPYMELAAAVDVLHALAMVAFVAGLPVIFLRRRATLTRVVILYAVVFIVLSQLSEWLLNECFLTTMARYLRTRAGISALPADWFTVRVAEAIFDLRPSQSLIRLLGKSLVLLYLVGFWYQRRHRDREPVASGPHPQGPDRTPTPAAASHYRHRQAA